MLPTTQALKPRAPQADPSERMVECEIAGCDKVIPLSQSYSFIGGIATTGPTQIPAFVCGEAEQHFGCCMDHALLAYVLCLRDHVIAVHQAKEQAILARLAADLAAAPVAEDTPHA